MNTHLPCVEHDYQLQLFNSPLDKQCRSCGHREALTAKELRWPADQARGSTQMVAKLTAAMAAVSALSRSWDPTNSRLQRVVRIGD